MRTADNVADHVERALPHASSPGSIQTKRRSCRRAMTSPISAKRIEPRAARSPRVRFLNANASGSYRAWTPEIATTGSTPRDRNARPSDDLKKIALEMHAAARSRIAISSCFG